MINKDYITAKERLNFSGVKLWTQIKLKSGLKDVSTTEKTSSKKTQRGIYQWMKSKSRKAFCLIFVR
jgi:hypothetical protein